MWHCVQWTWEANVFSCCTSAFSTVFWFKTMSETRSYRIEFAVLILRAMATLICDPSPWLQGGALYRVKFP